MGRPKKANRSEVAGLTLTLRLTSEDRKLLNELVGLRATELADDGGAVTMASLVRSLIKREARTKGLLPSEAPRKPKKR